jgi:hypothetical protein
MAGRCASAHGAVSYSRWRNRDDPPEQTQTLYRVSVLPVPRAGCRLPAVPPRQRSRSRRALRRAGEPRARADGTGDPGRGACHLVARSPLRDARGCRRDLRVQPPGAPVDRLRGSEHRRHRRHLRQLHGWDSADHLERRLEVDRHHPRPRHALQRYRPPGDGLRRRDAGRPPACQARGQDRPGPLTRGCYPDRERARPRRRPLRPRHPLHGHRLFGGEQPGRRAARGRAMAG